MKRERAVHILFIVMTAVVLMAAPAIADWGKTQIQLHCYKGNRADNYDLGTVAVYDLARPSSHCNIMYGDCDGACTACYMNEESLEVCADNSNEPYLY